MYVFLAEVFGELLAVELIKVLTGIGKLVGTAHHERIVRIVDDSLQIGHRLRIDDRCHMVTYEKQPCFGVVHYVVDLLGVELMENGYSHSPIGQCGNESHSPL